MPLVENPSGLPLGVQRAITAFVAISWHNSIWINLAAALVFKKRKSVYFYLLLISSWGCVLHNTGTLMLFFKLTDKRIPTLLLLDIGFFGMITGQSLVLYSRLHLITRNRSNFRWVLVMIGFNCIAFQVPTVTLYALSLSHPDIQAWYPKWEKTEVTVLGIQEIVISSIYIYETRKLLKPSETFQKERFRRGMRHLIYASIIVIMLDLTVMGLQYANFFNLQVTFKGAVYSVKLLIEFFVLNELRSIVGGGSSSGGYNQSTTSRGVAGQADTKDQKPSRKPRILSRGYYLNMEGEAHGAVKLEEFPSAEKKGPISNQKLGNSQPPVISADKDNKNMPAQPDKILVSRTVEYVAAQEGPRSRAMAPKSNSRPLSSSSSEEHFAQQWE